MVLNQHSPVDEDHLSKKTKLIRENFFPREPPVFKGDIFEGEYQDLLELLEWEQTSTGTIDCLVPLLTVLEMSLTLFVWVQEQKPAVHPSAHNTYLLSRPATK